MTGRVALAGAAGLAAGLLFGRSPWARAIRRQTRFSISILEGPSPFHLARLSDTTGPHISAEDLTDLEAEFVADPFMTYRDNRWFLFFEALDGRTQKGVICVATADDARGEWTYEGVVLREPVHLSYPHIVRWRGDYYMLPEVGEAHEVRLYRADSFPTRWSPVATLLKGEYLDPTPFEHEGRWWMFASVHEAHTHLFSAPELIGPWREHPASPVVRGDASQARPGGRVIFQNGMPIRLGQDCEPYYGRQLRAFAVEQLDQDSYRERELPESPILTPGLTPWSTVGMHHLDAHQQSDGSWIACADGASKSLVVGLPGQPTRSARQLARRALGGLRGWRVAEPLAPSGDDPDD